jgi:hypothetical protein
MVCIEWEKVCFVNKARLGVNSVWNSGFDPLFSPEKELKPSARRTWSHFFSLISFFLKEMDFWSVYVSRGLLLSLDKI